MKFYLTILAAFSALTVWVSAEVSVLRVSSTLQSYNISQPWEKQAPYNRRGLAVVIGKNQILTTAEMVANATFIELQTADGEKSIPATVIAVDYEANLALLAAKDPEDIKFIESMKPVELATPSKLGETVQVFQIEDNGMPLLTNGIIRGTDVVSTFVDGHFFLNYEIKAAMQSAPNSFTIPVLKDNKLAGLLTSYSSKDQLLDATATEIISAFIKDAADGKYVGFPDLGVSIVRTSDENFRGWLKLTDAQGGVFINRVQRNSSAEKAGIKVGDVILKVADSAINRRGYYTSKNYGELYWSHLIRGTHVTGDEIQITLLRDGIELVKQVKLERPIEGIIPSHTYGKAPRYMIKGGFVFQELTESYLKLFGDDWKSRAPMTLLDALNHPEDYEKGKKRLVILSRTIPTKATIGYERIRATIVTKVNGQEIPDIPALIKAFKTPGENGIHTIELDNDIEKIYLDAETASKVEAEFLQQGLPALSRDKE